MDEMLTVADLEAIRQSDHDCNCPVCDELVMRLVDTLAAERAQAAPVLAAAESVAAVWALQGIPVPGWEQAHEVARLCAVVAAWRAAREG